MSRISALGPAIELPQTKVKVAKQYLCVYGLGGQERNLELRHCVFCDGRSARLKFVSEEDIFPVPDS